MICVGCELAGTQVMLYKFRTLKPNGTTDTPKVLIERILDIVNGHRLYCQNWRNFVDQNEGAYLSIKQNVTEVLRLLESSVIDKSKIASLFEKRRSANDNVGVCCLTKGPLESEELWEVYGGGGCGVAIEFELKGLRLKPPFYEIRYGSKDGNGLRNMLKVLNEVNGEITRISESLLTWKENEYAFENEVRIICEQRNLEAVMPDDCRLDPLMSAIYRLEAMERRKDYYFDYSKFLEVKRLCCGSKVNDEDFSVLKESIHNIPVIKMKDMISY